ncbi:MAG: hypothetical protein JWO11_4138 [Nocardioides sp.]|nr:hypothetical protein [Nocardioides sp.]
MSADVDALVAFLRARLDEDEQVARDARSYDSEAEAEDFGPTTYQVATWAKAEPPVRAFVDGMSPARVLRDIEAKRRMLSEMIPILDDLDHIADMEGKAPRHPVRPGEYLGEDGAPAAFLLKLLALPHADHHLYREEWKL